MFRKWGLRCERKLENIVRSTLEKKEEKKQRHELNRTSLFRTNLRAAALALEIRLAILIQAVQSFVGCWGGGSSVKGGCGCLPRARPERAYAVMVAQGRGLLSIAGLIML